MANDRISKRISKLLDWITFTLVPFIIALMLVAGTSYFRSRRAPSEVRLTTEPVKSDLPERLIERMKECAVIEQNLEKCEEERQEYADALNKCMADRAVDMDDSEQPKEEPW